MDRLECTRQRSTGALGVAAVVGGTLLVVGALLPWMSFFAGLKPLRGTTGLNGYLVIAAGVAALAGGLWLLCGRTPRRVAPAIGALGAVLAIFAGWLLVQLRLAVERLSHGAGAMLVPRPGHGLHVVLAGALLLVVASGARSVWVGTSG